MSGERVPPVAPLWTYPITFLAILALGVVMGEVIGIERATDPHSLDHHVVLWIARNRPQQPWVTAVARGVTRLGNTEFATPGLFAAVLALFVLSRKGLGGIRRGEAFFWLAVAAGGRGLSALLKLWFQRERPALAHRLVAENSYSFPSGHSLFAAIFFVLTATLVARNLSKRLGWIRWVLIGALLALSLAVASSRIWLGVHYLTDVIGGFTLGLAWATSASAIRSGWWARIGGRRGAISSP